MIVKRTLQVSSSKIEVISGISAELDELRRVQKLLDIEMASTIAKTILPALQNYNLVLASTGVKMRLVPQMGVYICIPKSIIA
jgi:hypothetical protein